jgi:hypothetical protein
MALRVPSDDELTTVFADAVMAQARCIDQGDARTGNRHAKKYIAAAREILARGEEAIELFSNLLEHSDTGVRVAAAAYLLKSRTDRAVATLRPIAKGRGLASLGAQMTLKRYERGELEIKE